MQAEERGILLDVVDHLNKQNLKMKIIRDSLACQRENEGWYYVLYDMMEDGEAVRDSVSMYFLRQPDENATSNGFRP